MNNLSGIVSIGGDGSACDLSISLLRGAGLRFGLFGNGWIGGAPLHRYRGVEKFISAGLTIELFDTFAFVV